ncbi:hypothetical protein [Mycolicibacterium gilvum]|uniref:hypothetical protein n=1 Tax=Mycolicibacterium gilvum TaxID=1804 RepID=UPI0040463133
MDIGLWHSLKINPDTGGPYLSSRRLLNLLERLPEESEFKKQSERGGRQSRAERVREDTYNEIAKQRVSFHAAHGGEAAVYEPFLYRDPVDERLIAERKAEEAKRAIDSQGDFESQLGY